MVGPLDPVHDRDAELLAGGPAMSVEDVFLQEAEGGFHRDLEQIVRPTANEIGTQLLAIASDSTRQHGRLLGEISGVDARPENQTLEFAWHTFDLVRDRDEYPRGSESTDGSTQQEGWRNDWPMSALPPLKQLPNEHATTRHSHRPTGRVGQNMYL